MGWSCSILCLACHSDLLIRELQASFESRVIQKSCMLNKGHAMAQLVEALRYKPEGRGFDSHWCHERGLELDLASNRNE